MSIHVVLFDLGREWRGGQRQVVYLAHRLARCGTFLPVIATPYMSPLAGAARDADLQVISLAGSRPWDLRSFYALDAHMRGKCCILHTNDAHSAAVGALLRRWRPQTCLVHTRRVSYPLRRGWHIRKYLAANAVVGVSAEIGQVLCASGIPADKVHVIHSGIEASLYPARRARGDGRLVIGMVGALTRQKGHDVLIRALGELQRTHGAELPPWEVRIVGEGPLLSSVVARAKKEGIEGRMAYFGRQDSKVMMPDFDMLIVPSVDGEGSSAVIKEGWAVGIPVIASDLPSNLELMRPGENGLVFPKGDAGALAAAIRSLAIDTALGSAVVQGGKGSLEEFSVERMTIKYMELYQTLL